MTHAANLIQSQRLNLIRMTAEFLTACLAGDLLTAERLLGLTIPAAWLAERSFIELRLNQVRQDPAYTLWMPRAIALRQNGAMIGHIGFHTQPGAAYLREIAPAGVEFGYTVYKPYQRQGYALEACAALVQWAQAEQPIQHFVLSISPHNLPSLRIAQHFGFQKVGSQLDEVDGLEDIYVLEV
jgi:RimJ/RimL family protein N-acetyltransferase